MSYFMRDLVEEKLVDAEWEDVALFSSYQNEQSLLYEHADTLAARAFLKMASLPFHLEQRPNAEFISPNGKLPFLKIGRCLIADFSAIVDFVSKKGIKLSNGQKHEADMYAHMSLIEQTLRPVEMCITWLHDATYSKVTRRRYGSVYEWPLCWILPAVKRREMRQRLAALGWADRSSSQLAEAAERVFRALSSRLAHNDFFMGETATELDALVFGHLYTILTTELPSTDMVNALRRYPNLVDFCKRIDVAYFS